jgi:hypothetical protein
MTAETGKTTLTTTTTNNNNNYQKTVVSNNGKQTSSQLQQAPVPVVDDEIAGFKILYLNQFLFFYI